MTKTLTALILAAFALSTQAVYAADPAPAASSAKKAEKKAEKKEAAKPAAAASAAKK